MRTSHDIEKGIAAFTAGSVDEPRKEFPGVDTRLNVQGPYAYSVLKLATHTFLMLESGVVNSRKRRSSSKNTLHGRGEKPIWRS